MTDVVSLVNLLIAGVVNLVAFVSAFFFVRERIARLEERAKSLQVQMNQERESRSADMREIKEVLSKMDMKMDQISQRMHEIDIKVHSNNF